MASNKNKANNDTHVSAGWWLYLVRMKNGSLYCGVTIDVTRRFQEHCAGGVKAARTLKGKGPLTLVFSQYVGDKRRAMQLERQLKNWPKTRKEALVLGAAVLP